MNDSIVIKEIGNLQALLNKTMDQMKQISKIRHMLDRLEGIEKAELQRLLSACDMESFAGDAIDRLLDILKHIQTQRTVGRLVYADNDRYWLKSKGKKILEFHSGSGIEVFVEDKEHDDYGWNFGRVEYDHGQKGFNGYYFFNTSGFDHHPLHAGMLAAIRRK